MDIIIKTEDRDYMFSVPDEGGKVRAKFEFLPGWIGWFSIFEDGTCVRCQNFISFQEELHLEKPTLEIFRSICEKWLEKFTKHKIIRQGD